ncbi:hypothetical protein DEJ50_13680 [Streptomyces venezuelae]|uniref:Translation initiation factor 2 n=1 Tax=Streptomyces venezuelae TaxID=54571 RepID=A0A5P2D2D8_STRVZ|nr:hypothetical protein [Streptomyces venezuelae]QES48720.1 hypothetical protein DEJ50_13680 [Streptomyces venezuelae]
MAGDPVLDELAASRPFRSEYRAALGIRPGQKLLLVSSTWSERSLLGASFELISRALAELPQDEFRVIAAVHPNVWYGHGGWQIRSWLAACRRAGLLLPSPAGPTWKAAICAADAFVGDHGSLSLYAAAQGLPGLLAAFDEHTVAPGSPMAWLGERLPRICPTRPLARQLADAVRLPVAADRVSSRPGQALELFRELCYRHLKLPVPQTACPPRPVPVPVSVPELPAEARSPVGQALYVDAVVSGERVTVRRYPADLQGRRTAHLGADPHLLADEAEPVPGRRDSAEVLLARGSAPAELFDRHPACELVVAEGRLHLRGGRVFTAVGADPVLAASALLAGAEGTCTLEAGGTVAQLTLRPA